MPSVAHKLGYMHTLLNLVKLIKRDTIVLEILHSISKEGYLNLIAKSRLKNSRVLLQILTSLPLPSNADSFATRCKVNYINCRPKLHNRTQSAARFGEYLRLTRKQ